MGLSQLELAKSGGISKSAGSSDMDAAAGISSAAQSITTTALSLSKSPTVSGTVAVLSEAEATPRVERHGPIACQTLNGSAMGMNCQGAAADSSQTAAVTLANGPVSVSKGVTSTPSTIIRTPMSAQNATISSQSCVKTVPTVTLVRPPMQTPGSTSHTVLSSPPVIVTCTTGNPVNKADSSKTVMLTSAVRCPTVLQNQRTTTPSTIVATPGGTRAIAPQVLAPRLTQPQQNPPSVQNIQLPPGMVLVRSESGQLLMIHQQTLAQMQVQSQSQTAMGSRSTTTAQITSLQTPGASLLTRSATPTTIIKQSSQVASTVAAATTTLQRPPVLQSTIMLGGSTGVSGTAKTPVAVTQTIGATSVPPTAVTAETLENVKKCRNFLSTLIKLASGKQSSETTANVKELVKSLLEAKLEPEDFTSRLYRELNSSPQPYLVPFLKRSLPALRQMTPDSEAFIQQSLLPLPSTQPAASTALTAVVLRPPLSTAVGATAAPIPNKTTVISLAPSPVIRPQVTLNKPSIVTVRGQTPGRIIVSQPQVIKQMPAVSVVKQTFVPSVRGVQVFNQASLTEVQKNKLKEGGGTFKDDDDINDVASMAGVNVSEESARILATNAELVGMVTRSCKDEAFLSTASLTRLTLEIGKKFGVSELGADVISYISHATQQRLQNILEKVSLVAQQKNMAFKEDERYEQISDVRTQLKFFEQLDQMEKQRKEEQEREILLKAAKSRSRQEDPEQLRLKQKAKEMQQLELAQIRQREANLTALAAIGPRKKRKTDSPVKGANSEGSGSSTSQSGGSSSRQFVRQRITRVNLRDLLFCLENEKETSRSQLLYKGFLK